MPARPSHSPARRTVLHSAWAAPLVVAATAAPAFATSGAVKLTLKLSFSYKPNGSQDKATFTFTATENGLPVTDTAELVFFGNAFGTTASTPVTITNGSGTLVLTFSQYIAYNSKYTYAKLTYHGASSPRIDLFAF